MCNRQKLRERRQSCDVRAQVLEKISGVLCVSSGGGVELQLTTTMRILLFLPVLAALIVVEAADAKPAYYQRVKLRLLMENVRCQHCHVTSDSDALNDYGKMISGVKKKDAAFFERWLEAEREPSALDDEKEVKEAERRLDVDGDGVQNWIEILAGSDPANAEVKPDPAGSRSAPPISERIAELISCKLCHIRTDAPAGPGRSRAPHNLFGIELAKLNEEDPTSDSKARTGGWNRAADQPADILLRLESIGRHDADRDRISNWDEIRLFHHPGDRKDRPNRMAVNTLRAAERSGRPKDAGLGPHALGAPFVPPGKQTSPTDDDEAEEGQRDKGAE
mgnify:CR=1 FL=1